MSDRARRVRGLVLALIPALVLPAAPAAAEPAVAILDLPFPVRALRGPSSEVALSVATSGLLPLARGTKAAGQGEQAAGDEPSAPVVVVWGEGGAAALGLADGRVTATLLGAEAIEAMAAAETPRGAVPGSRRAVGGALTAYLTGRTRAGGGEAAAGLTVRERQPVALSADPKPVPVATATVAAGPGDAFALDRPRLARLSGRPVVAVIARGETGSGLVLVGRPREGADWTVLARSPVEPGPVHLAGVADFAGAGAPQAAVVAGEAGTGTLQAWTLGAESLTPGPKASGYAGGEDLAAIVEGRAGEAPELALPVADRRALAVVTLKDGIRERLRVPLPAPAAVGVAALGRGPGAHLLVGLADGRLATVALDGRP